MKTIIVKTTSEQTKKLFLVIERLEKYIDRQIKDAVICTKFCDETNYISVGADMKEALKINDYDVYLIGVTDMAFNVDLLKTVNKPRTLCIDDNEIDLAKNYIIMK